MLSQVRLFICYDSEHCEFIVVFDNIIVFTYKEQNSI